MEKYRIIKTLLDSIKNKHLERAKKFRQYRLLSAYCDNEVSIHTKQKVESSLALSCELVQRTLKINSLRKALNQTFENKFANLELNLEKKVIERVKNYNIFCRMKKFFMPKFLSLTVNSTTTPLALSAAIKRSAACFWTC